MREQSAEAACTPALPRPLTLRRLLYLAFYTSPLSRRDIARELDTLFHNIQHMLGRLREPQAWGLALAMQGLSLADLK